MDFATVAVFVIWMILCYSAIDVGLAASAVAHDHQSKAGIARLVVVGSILYPCASTLNLIAN